MNDMTSDNRTSEELLAAALASARSDPSDQSEERWALVRTLHRRADRTIFQKAASWCLSNDVAERVLGADLLAQLGAGSDASRRLFAPQSEPFLSKLLRDPEDRVVMSALYALGHLDAGDPAEIAQSSTHTSPDVRHAVAYALGGRIDALSIQVLTALSNDPDDEVRDWATFGLGTLCELDTADVREALFARLSDCHSDVREEALLGLATRGDQRAVPHIISALKEGSPSHLILEAAEEMLKACPSEDELRHLATERRQ